MKKIVLIPVSLIVFLLIFSSIVYWQIYHKNFSINNIITIEIKEGDGVRPLTERLEREGAVPSAVVLRKFLSFKGVDRKIQSGMYIFVSPFSVVTIADTLLHPEKSEVEVTIIPGTDMRDITNYLFGILLATAVIFFIIAGFNFVTAQGDPEKVKRARDFVLWAIIGLLVAFVSVGLVNFIKALAESSK